MSPKRNYRQIKTGQAVKGVTTILSILSKPPLIFWGYRQGMENYERLMKSISNAHGIIKDLKDKELLMMLMRDFQPTGLYDKRDKAGNAGTLAHTFVENHVRGLSDPKTDGFQEEVIKKAEGCYLTFLDWEKANKIKYIGSEVELTSEVFPYGGTIDYVIQSAMTPVDMVDILDIKTGKDIYLEAKLQVRAYKILWDEKDERKVAGFHILRLGENGEFNHEYYPGLDEGYFKVFLNLLGVTIELARLNEKL